MIVLMPIFSDCGAKGNKNPKDSLPDIFCQYRILQGQACESCMFANFQLPLLQHYCVWCVYDHDVNIWMLQVGFNPMRVLRKRNKALRKIKKVLKDKDSDITEVRYKTTTNSALYYSFIKI